MSASSSSPPSTPPTGRRAAQRRRRRRRIAQAAGRLFHARGFDDVTTEEIAAAADVSKGTLFNYARTKDHLLLLVYQSDLEDAVEVGLGEVDSEGPIPEALLALFQGFFRVYEADRPLAQRFIRTQLFLQPGEGEDLNALTYAFLGQLAGLLKGWQGAGRLRGDVDLGLAAQCIFMLYFGGLQGWLTGHTPDPAARDAQLLGAFTLLLQGMALRE